MLECIRFWWRGGKGISSCILNKFDEVIRVSAGGMNTLEEEAHAYQLGLSHCRNESLILALEDDIWACKGLGKGIHQVVREADVKHGLHGWNIIKLFSHERFKGWGTDNWHVWFSISLLITAVVFVALYFVIRCTRSQTFSRAVFFCSTLSVSAGLCAVMIMLTIGRQHMFQVYLTGLNPMEPLGAVSTLFNNRNGQIGEFLPYLNSKRAKTNHLMHGPKLAQEALHMFLPSSNMLA